MKNKINNVNHKLSFSVDDFRKEGYLSALDAILAALRATKEDGMEMSTDDLIEAVEAIKERDQ